MDLPCKNGLKSRKLWRKLLELLKTLCMIWLWKSGADRQICGKPTFFHKLRPQGKMYKETAFARENVEKWK